MIMNERKQRRLLKNANTHTLSYAEINVAKFIAFN